MVQCQTQQQSQVHSETIENTAYEVISNYIGNISLIDLLKLMIKRDITKSNH